MKRIIAALFLFVASAAHADWPIRVDGLSTASGETNFAYDASQECFYLDVDQDGTHDFSAIEQCVDGTSGDSSGVPYDGRLNWCSPIAYEENGSTTTEGIQECIDYLGTLGGGTVLLGPRGYFPTTAITINESGEVRLQGAGRDGTSIQCLVGCSGAFTVEVLDNNVTISDLTLVNENASRTGVLRIGDASNYVSGVQVTNVHIDADDQSVAGSRVGDGILLQGLRNTFRNMRIRYAQDCVQITANTGAGVNANIFDTVDMRNCDDGVDMSIGGVAANTSDGVLKMHGGSIETIYGYGVHVRGGSGDTSYTGSPVYLRDVYMEGMDTGVYVDSSSGIDPIVYWIGGECAAMADSAADADSEGDCVIMDSDTSSFMWIQGVAMSQQHCLTHNGTGDIFFGGLANFDSGCTVGKMTLAAGAYAHDFMDGMDAMRSIASATAVTNTDVETAFSTCSYTVPANSVGIGSIFRITAGGTESTDATNPQIAIRVRWGSANTNPLLLDLGPTTANLASATSDGWSMSGLITIRSIGGTGTAVGNGFAVFPASAGAGTTIWDNQSSTTTIDTTAATALTVFADWTTTDTDNTITAETCVIERVQ